MSNRDAPGTRLVISSRVGAGGDDLGQERHRGFARERGQDADLMRQLERGRTRPGEFHEEPLTDGHAARVPLRVLFAGRAGNRDRVPAQLRRHDPQGLAERLGRALSQPFHRLHLISSGRSWQPPGPASYQHRSTDRSGNRPISRRIAASSLAIRSVAGLSWPGSSDATTIAFLEVSIPRWISPAWVMPPR